MVSGVYYLHSNAIWTDADGKRGKLVHIGTKEHSRKTYKVLCDDLDATCHARTGGEMG